MTDPTPPRRGDGEQALRDRRRQFWKMVRTSVLASMGVGVAIGVIAGFAHSWQADGGYAFGWVLWPIVAAAMAAFVVFSRTYFAKVDEVDLADNLWCSLIGLYFFICAMPTWALMHHVGQMPAINPWWLWGATLIVTVAAYGWRKWQGLRG